LNWPLFFSALWSIGLLIVYLRLSRLSYRRKTLLPRAWLIIGAIALFARLVPNFALRQGAGYDIGSYQMVADLLLSGKEIYAVTAPLTRHPYLPFQMYWLALARWIASVVHMPFVQVVRLAPIGADAAIAVVLYQSLRRFGSKAALSGGLAYALNPIPIFVSAYHGQFDAIPALFTLLALVWLDRSPLMAGGWLGLGILNKRWPVLALPSLFVGVQGWRKRLAFAVATLLVILAGVGFYTALFHVDISTVLQPAVSYNWGVGIWGYTYLPRLLAALSSDNAQPFNWLISYGRYVTLMTLALVWLWRARKESPEAGVLTVLVSFLAFGHAFSIQYLLWVVPFAILVQDTRWLRLYTMAAFAYMFLAYMTFILTMSINRILPLPQADWFIIMPAGLPVWLVSVGWAVDRLCGKGARG